MQDYNYYFMQYNETPKFRSFGDFPALQRLGVEYNTLSVQASLLLLLHSVAIQHCRSSKSTDILLYLGSHQVLEAIQFNNTNGGATTIFQQ
jgi:hypothetical protein